MPVNVNQQTVVFLMCVLTGMVSGFICDFLSIASEKLHFNKSAVFVQDILIWCLILVFYFSVLYRINGAELSWFVFLGAAIGALLYLLTFKGICAAVIEGLMNFLVKILKRILTFLMFPIRKLARFFASAVKYVQSALKKSKKFVQKNIEKLGRIKVLLKKV